MSRTPGELHFSHGDTTYRAILMDEHVACGVIYEEACMICGYQLGNLTFYTTHPFIFCAHTACLLQSQSAPPPTNHEASREICSNPYPPLPMYHESSHDIFSNPNHPPNTFYHPYQPTLPPYGNIYASNYHPIPNYSYTNPPNVPNYVNYPQPPYPPPNVPNYVNYAQTPCPPPNVPNYVNYAQTPYPPPNVPNYVNYAQSPYPPPNSHNHGHGNSASSSGRVGGRLMGMVGVSALGAFLQVLFQTMLS